MKKIIIVIASLMFVITTALYPKPGVDTVSAATGSSSSSSSTSTSTGSVPAAPSGLKLQSGSSPGENGIILVWSDNSRNESRFSVQRTGGGQTVWKEIGTVGANVTVYADEGLTPATSYEYRIKAVNSYGSSAASNILAVAIAPKPQTVSPVQTPAATTGSASIVPAIKPSNQPASWAVIEINQAEAIGLIPGSLANAYNMPITRREFVELVMRLYDETSANDAASTEPHPFSDTDDPAVIQAFNLDIVLGTGNGLFLPENSLIRQEAAVILMREMKAAFSERDFVFKYDVPYHDRDLVAPWASYSMAYLNEQGILVGTGDGRIDPTGALTREQAIVLTFRIYNAFGTSDAAMDEQTVTSTRSADDDYQDAYEQDDDYEDEEDDD